MTLQLALFVVLFAGPALSHGTLRMPDGRLATAITRACAVLPETFVSCAEAPWRAQSQAREAGHDDRDRLVARRGTDDVVAALPALLPETGAGMTQPNRLTHRTSAAQEKAPIARTDFAVIHETQGFLSKIAGAVLNSTADALDSNPSGLFTGGDFVGILHGKSLKPSGTDALAICGSGVRISDNDERVCS